MSIAEPQSYPCQPPPSYDALYIAKAPDLQGQQVVHVVHRQPQHIVIARPAFREPPSFIVYSVVCVVFTAICAWPCLVCSIPALILSFLSRDNSARGNREVARTYGRWALGFNTAALVSIIVFIILVIVFSEDD